MARRATGIARTRLAALVDLGVIERQWVMRVVSVRGITQDIDRIRVRLGGCESIGETRKKGYKEAHLVVNVVPIINTAW